MTPAQISKIMSLVQNLASVVAQGLPWHNAHDAIEAALRDAPQAEGWRDHVEQRIRTWRQSTMNKSGDRLAIDDFMGQESIDDLVDFVCDEYAFPSAPTTVEPNDLHIAYMAGFADGKKARPAVEPVAYSMTRNGSHVGSLYSDKDAAQKRMEYLNQNWPENNRAVVPLFATPHTAPVPLSDAEIEALLREFDPSTRRLPPGIAKFARAIERAVLGRGGEKDDHADQA